MEGLDAPKENCCAPSLELLSGVDGGLEDSGTWNPDILSRFICQNPHARAHNKIRGRET